VEELSRGKSSEIAESTILAETAVGGNLFFEQKVSTPVPIAFAAESVNRALVGRETLTAVLPPLAGIRKVLSPLW
jgi:hypothetical protein